MIEDALLDAAYEREDKQQDTIDALVAALEHIQRQAKDRSEKAWFRLDMIADEADAALALARGEG